MRAVCSWLCNSCTGLTQRLLQIFVMICFFFIYNLCLAESHKSTMPTPHDEYFTCYIDQRFVAKKTQHLWSDQVFLLFCFSFLALSGWISLDDNSYGLIWRNEMYNSDYWYSQWKCNKIQFNKCLFFPFVMKSGRAKRQLHACSCYYHNRTLAFSCFTRCLCDETNIVCFRIRYYHHNFPRRIFFSSSISSGWSYANYSISSPTIAIITIICWKSCMILVHTTTKKARQTAMTKTPALTLFLFPFRKKMVTRSEM